MAENGSFRAKKGRVGRVNFNLYHYAGNNPVKYTDPDGREQFSPFSFNNPVAEFWGWISSFSSGSDTIVASTIAASNGNQTAYNQLNSLSPYMGEAMAKVTGDVLIGGMEFMAENGTTLALVAYASGHVEVGAVIDGITIACDVTLAFMEARESGDYSKFAKTVAADFVSVAVGNGVSNAASKACKSAIGGIPNSVTETAIDSLANILSEYAGGEAGNITKLTADELFN